MLRSGSHVPGFDWNCFGIPAGTALRFEQTAAPLRRYFASYAVLDSDPAVFTGPNSWLLPGWAQIWIVLAEAPITAKLRNRLYAPLGSAILYGPTSRAMPITSHGGVSIVVEVSPLGWARWIDRPAEDYRDRITPLQEFLLAKRIDALIGALHDSDRGPAVKVILDDFFLSDMPPSHPQDALITQVTNLLANPDLTDTAQVAAMLDISPQALLRLCRRHFGYGPKLLMRRVRFLRALTALMIADADVVTVPAGYHDASHFIRDGNEFLGLTPRRFLQMPMSYLRAVIRARAAIIGGRWAMLDPT